MNGQALDWPEIFLFTFEDDNIFRITKHNNCDKISQSSKENGEADDLSECQGFLKTLQMTSKERTI